MPLKTHRNNNKAKPNTTLCNLSPLSFQGPPVGPCLLRSYFQGEAAAVGLEKEAEFVKESLIFGVSVWF